MFRFLLILIVSGFIMGEQAVIVDVRTQDEWNQGHLETALHIELDKIETINDNYDFKDHKILSLL